MSGLSVREFAAHAGISETTVRNWEGGRTYPRLQPLRRIRDGLGMPPMVFERALRRFVRGNGAVRAPSDEGTSKFWRMMAAPVGSSLETRLLNDLVRDHRSIAVRAARRFSGWSHDMQDLEQAALIALPNILRCYVPARGRLLWYALKACRMRILGYISDAYYFDVPAEFRSSYRRVYRCMRTHVEQFGRQMPEADVIATSGLPRALVREAMQFHARRVCSLDDEDGRIRSRHETVGVVPEAMARAELVADVERELKRAPEAVALVVAVAIDGESLQCAGDRLGLTLPQASELYERALRDLETWAVATGSNTR